jgi:hypothetical protein
VKSGGRTSSFARRFAAAEILLTARVAELPDIVKAP